MSSLLVKIIKQLSTLFRKSHSRCVKCRYCRFETVNTDNTVKTDICFSRAETTYPLGLKTQKETKTTMKKQPLRKGSARVAKMKVYPKGLFLTILEIQSQSNTILTGLYTQGNRWLLTILLIEHIDRLFLTCVTY